MHIGMYACMYVHIYVGKHVYMYASHGTDDTIYSTFFFVTLR